MSLFADIETLEQKLQKEIARAGSYKSIQNFLQVYQESILQSLEGYTRSDLNNANLQNILTTALEEARDYIDIQLADQIRQGVTTTIEDTITFYDQLGIQPVNLIEGIERREEILKLTEEFNNNMSTMREELLDGTLEKMEEVIAKEGLNRSRLSEEIFEFADGKAHWARTNAKMVVSSSNRIARDELRQSADLQHGFYYGEVRSNTRAFCRSCAGGTYTLKQIENMSNGQGLDVKIYAGGWNCIHSWLWVEPEWDPELKRTMEENRPVVELTEEYLDLKVPE